MKNFELLEVVFGGCDTEDCLCEETVEVEGKVKKLPVEEFEVGVVEPVEVL